MWSMIFDYALSVMIFVIEVFGLNINWVWGVTRRMNYYIQVTHLQQWLSLHCVHFLVFFLLSAIPSHWWMIKEMQSVKVCPRPSSAYLGKRQRPNTSIVLQCISLFLFSGHPNRSHSPRNHLAAAGLLNQLENFVHHFMSMRHRHKEHRQISRARAAVHTL